MPTHPTAHRAPNYRYWLLERAPIFGAAVAITVVALYGRPLHTAVTLWVMAIATGLGVTVGFHRLFAHHSFAASRSVECTLMILGCMAGLDSPFCWIASHRAHHCHSDQDDDPLSLHIWAGQRVGFLRGVCYRYFGWLRANVRAYPELAIKDLTSRPDLAWIDRHWLWFYLLGLAIPAIVGFLIGGTAYDALIGFLWGGLFRHFLIVQMNFVADIVDHRWGTQPYDIADQSRNNFLVGLVAFGEGWHNNHHAFPYSARFGFYWWQPDLAWCLIWLMERVGLAWRVKRPRRAGRREISITRSPGRSPVVAHPALAGLQR